jgi:hypothetical protein
VLIWDISPGQRSGCSLQKAGGSWQPHNLLWLDCSK